MAIITEIVVMKTAEVMEKDEFIRIADSLEKEFHSKQGGFIDTELLWDEGREEWIMIQHWSSAQQQKAASKMMFQAEEAALFVRSLDPKSVKMKILPQLKTWKL